DDRQQIVEVVRQPAGEIADRLHFLYLMEMLLESPSLRHILDHTDEILRQACVISNDEPSRRNQSRRAVQHLDETLDDIGRSIGCQQRTVSLHDHGCSFFGKNLTGGLADDLRTPHAPQVLAGSVDQYVTLLPRFFYQDRRRDVFDDKVEKLPI